MVIREIVMTLWWGVRWGYHGFYAEGDNLIFFNAIIIVLTISGYLFFEAILSTAFSATSGLDFCRKNFTITASVGIVAGIALATLMQFLYSSFF